MAEKHDYNVSAASNTARWPEQMLPSAVNNAARQNEAIEARDYYDMNGSVEGTLSGSLVSITANRTSLTLTGTTANYFANMMIAWTAGSAFPNSGNLRATINTIGAKEIRDNIGNSLSSSFILAGTRVLMVKDATNDYFRVLWPAPLNSKAIKLGTHTVWLPAGAFTPTTTNGMGSGTTELATNDVMLSTYDADWDTDEFIQAMIGMPKSWNEGTVTAEVLWTAASGSGDVIWGVQALSVGNDDAMDAAFGTAVTVTDTLLTANDLHVTAATSAITASGTPAEGDMLVVQVYRDANAAGDTLGVDAKFIGLRLFITIDAADDS